MQIELKSIPIRDLIDGYLNDPDAGVVGYGGRLDIRPPYQREFRYDLKQQQAVIDTVMKGFPLNIMYWSVVGDDQYEMIDGQQRTLSICEFFNHEFNIEDPDRGVLYFGTLTDEEKQKFLNYGLTVYFCTGTDREKLDWFRVINIAGERLLDQELRNAVYVGPFVSDARRHFSKTDAPPTKSAATTWPEIPSNRLIWRPCSNGPHGKKERPESTNTWHDTSTTRMRTSCGPTTCKSSRGFVRPSRNTARR